MPGFTDDIGKLTPHLRRFARTLVRGHAAGGADDLVQETIILAARADFPKQGLPLAVWCFAALIRLNRLRNRAPVAMAESDAGAPLPFLPKDIIRLDALPLDFREVLLLTTVAGLPYAQVAQILDLDLTQIFARLTQARDLLARADTGVAGRASRAGDRARQGDGAHLRLVK